MIHHLSGSYDIPERFNDPFRYSPHPMVSDAAREVMCRIDGSDELISAFAEGKMLGVLIVKDSHGGYGYLAGFSGNVGGKSTIEGFVPPIYDLTDPSGHFKQGEAELNAINSRISALQNGKALSDAKKEYSAAKQQMEAEISAHRDRMAAAKAARDKARDSQSRKIEDDTLIRESQFLKAELKRIKDRWKAFLDGIQERIDSIQDEMSVLKALRANKSDELQHWIFSQYIVQNALGERASVLEIFESQGLVPPGGTGECAAPKLLNHAFIHGLEPVAMGEFWYGQSPDTAVRTHGHFYPSCTSKCGPLLSYMTKGLTGSVLQGPPPSLQPVGAGWSVQKSTWLFPDRSGTPYPGVGISLPHISQSNPSSDSAAVTLLSDDIVEIYRDEAILVVEKRAGVPSVPGLDGRISLLEMLQERFGTNVEAVHRLDMDTSGVMVFARSGEAAVNLRKQFEDHIVKKTYMARLCPADSHRFASEVTVLNTGDKGTIELPLSPDYDERPRQKVDRNQGKEALTMYEVSAVNPDGTTDIIYHPHTGRTHQLRVHSAHILGLGRPILGDLLYGGHSPVSDPTVKSPATRLHLHAVSISFRHPLTDVPLTFTGNNTCY